MNRGNFHTHSPQHALKEICVPRLIDEVADCHHFPASIMQFLNNAIPVFHCVLVH